VKKILTFLVGIVFVCLPTLSSQSQSSDQPRYNAAGDLLVPSNYREWVWLSSGLGMAYGPAARENAASNPPFDNVFVTPSAYRSFVQTGKWPDKTMFVLELRRSLDKGSINEGGRFQGDRIGIEVEVKEASRYSGKWAFFEFREPARSAKALPVSAECYSCHADHGAVDNTFVQFYPTLIEVARRHGVFVEK